MATIFVRAKNPSQGFSDLGQSVIVAGSYPFEVTDSTRIKYGIRVGAIVEISEAEATKLTTSLNAKTAATAANRANNADKKADYAAAQADTDDNQEPDSRPDRSEEQRVIFSAYTAKELLALIGVVGQDPNDFKKMSKIQLVDWLVQTTSGDWTDFSRENAAYCRIPLTDDELWLYKISDVQDLTDAVSALLGTFSSPADDAKIAQVTAASNAWEDAGGEFNHSSYCNLVKVLVDSGYVKPA